MNFGNNNGMKSFNLKDLINIENIPKDILESIANNTPIDLGINDIQQENKDTPIEIENKDTPIEIENKDTPIEIENKDTPIEIENKDTPIEIENSIHIKEENEIISNNSEKLSEEDRIKNLEILKKKLRSKQEELNNSRKSKNQKEDSRIKMLKENPLFKNLGSLNTPEAKKMIDTMASKMCADPKQKKAIKKQMEKLINKMDSTTL
jgi:hypothetical protein